MLPRATAGGFHVRAPESASESSHAPNIVGIR
jgi:hypothetical protein